MPEQEEIGEWKNYIRRSYENYLKTSFYFKDTALRDSFSQALADYDLMKEDPFPEPAYNFQQGISAKQLLKEYFVDGSDEDILPALRDDALYSHQEQAIRHVYHEERNVVVATGTGSGKTESFLYPILFELYRQHLAGSLSAPGVRALILYPMNALAHDQRRRLGEICEALKEAGADFKPTFGQYIGDTPKNEQDRYRNAQARGEERFEGELVFREEMRRTPPHILLSNYSMLEYLLIRPEDSELFDHDRGRHWQFMVLDEAHQYRGTKGMEMGMLVRRLKQRLREGGRSEPFRCIATSATISSSQDQEDRQAVAEFAGELFGEEFSGEDIIFGQRELSEQEKPQRFHLFLRALEGAFLVHEGGEDKVVLDRKFGESDNDNSVPLEIALCRECGQHYYVGREHNGRLEEAIRDPSHSEFGVEFYRPLEENAGTNDPGSVLCRQCGALSANEPSCDCNAAIAVKQCASDKKNKDRLKECEVCSYRGNDPVQEIVHGSDGPNTVIATALHKLLPEERRKVLAFADSRQEAAFFAWYAEDSYNKVRDRNLILRALLSGDCDHAGLSISDLQSRLQHICDEAKVFKEKDTNETREREVLRMIYRELLADEKRISLEGVGLAKWTITIPSGFSFEAMYSAPWDLQEDEARELLTFLLLGTMRSKRAVELCDSASKPAWSSDISSYPQGSVCSGRRGGRKNVSSWDNKERTIIKHFLPRLLDDKSLKTEEKREKAQELMRNIWEAIQSCDRGSPEEDRLLKRASPGGTFRLNLCWLRVKPLLPDDELFECDTCASISTPNIRRICLRNKCPGSLRAFDPGKWQQNHYRVLYQDERMPVRLRSEEHTAQLESEEARKRQEEFSRGDIHLLSSSTTFEMGVDLGDLEVVFLRNVPPEPFNYTQRAGRAGRRDIPGLVLTYCRRNAHDLYHYIDPQKSLLEGKIRPPQLHLQNEKIILRHVTATAFSHFFRAEPERFNKVEGLMGGDWQATDRLRDFCKGDNSNLKSTLLAIVPGKMRAKTGLNNDDWIEKIAGEDSRFAYAENDVREEYRRMEELENDFRDKSEYQDADKCKRRRDTIAKEDTLSFLSRNAIIPKYGFPVDVVELDTRPLTNNEKVSLQRDLAQAIAEFAPGSKIVANKKEWGSCGVKKIIGKEFKVWHYRVDEARNFRRSEEPKQGYDRKYLWPQFGFVTSLSKKPEEPKGRARRLYTTRPYFGGFTKEDHPNTRNVLDVQITQALPGTMIVLCEGKNQKGFYICENCGAGFSERCNRHKTPDGTDCCKETLENYSLGHEFVTDIVRLEFPDISDEWEAYSLAYAMLLGAAQALDVPDTDLNVTITGGTNNQFAIVLYDNVPGGAGLVANLEKENVFCEILGVAKQRVGGECGCGITESCYGCLRNYRNQFAHPHLRREYALKFLSDPVTSTWK